MVKMRKGFTLIEVMIIVAIMGIIAAVAIPKLAYIFGGNEDVKWKVTQNGKTEIFPTCTTVYEKTCHDCKRDDGSEIRICGSYTIEKLTLD